MVPYICNPSYAGGMGRRMEVQGQPGAKNTRPYLKNNKSKKGLGL
jgi:hypothetical protein